MKTLTEVSISILNEIAGAINEMSSESDINQIYESIAEFIQTNKEEAESGRLQNLFKILQEKVSFYAELQQPNRMKILANFYKFVLRMRSMLNAHGAT